MMHCPSCGHESALDQKFCRKCGFNLEQVGKLVAGDSASAPVESDQGEAERKLVRCMFRWLSLGCVVLLIGVVLLYVVSRTVPPAPLLQFLASFFILGGIAIGGYGLFSSIIKGTYLSGKAAKNKPQIDQHRTTKELPEGRIPVPVPSVTERTTQLIGKDRN
jgi:hypothetical protein